MTAAPPLPFEDRSRLQRWVAAVGLLVAAEEAASTDVPESNAIGVLAAEAACEAMLGLLIGVYEQPPMDKQGREASFSALLDRVLELGVQVPPVLVADLRVTHRTRNGFVHAGMAIDHLEVERSVAAAHALSELVAMPGERPMSGIATLVADIVEIEAIGLWLRHADLMARRGQLRLAADAMARALDAALDRTVPRIRRRTGQSSFATVQELRRLGSGAGFDRSRQELVDGIDGLTRWVYPMALGVAPSTLDFVRSVIGEEEPYDFGGHMRPVRRPSDQALAEQHYRRAAAVVSRILLRLWVIGAVAPRRNDDQQVAIWKVDAATEAADNA